MQRTQRKNKHLFYPCVWPVTSLASAAFVALFLAFVAPQTSRRLIAGLAGGRCPDDVSQSLPARVTPGARGQLGMNEPAGLAGRWSVLRLGLRFPDALSGIAGGRKFEPALSRGRHVTHHVSTRHVPCSGRGMQVQQLRWGPGPFNFWKPLLATN